ncbi:AraC family transcriptional regulator [Mesobaculum littorinae]|uniref:AraC family transcriptional regulator n=1 Tax=Mesobaculum littorinae TaxID=2486419 RepID=A0A438ACT5_9RHOB|nr:AraC family transcriptional regulator [Mesobaculum littorinae]
MTPSSTEKNRPKGGPTRRFPPVAYSDAQVSVPYGVDSYAADMAEYCRQMGDAVLPVSNSHYRAEVRNAPEAGRYEVCRLGDGFFIRFAEMTYPEPRSAHFRSPDSLHIYLASSGDGEYLPNGGTPLSFEAPSAVLIIEPAGAPPAEVTLVGSMRYIYIVMHFDALRALYADKVHDLPALLQDVLEGGAHSTNGWALPLSAELLRCLGDVQTCPLEGHRRCLFLKSKTIEIFCHALEAFDKSDCLQSTRFTKSMARGVLKARRFLEQNFISPPSLEELAAEAGVSRSTLCTGFRQILGQSVYDYIRDLRMQRALLLLTERDDPLIQIAYAVGYIRPSSFSAAVQRHFGATPSELRQRSRSSSA